MTQSMVDSFKKYNQQNFNKLKVTCSTSTQTSDSLEFYINLSAHKSFRLYYSKRHKGYVLSLNFGNCKKYIITKLMWNVFRKEINRIDAILKI